MASRKSKNLKSLKLSINQEPQIYNTYSSQSYQTSSQSSNLFTKLDESTYLSGVDCAQDFQFMKEHDIGFVINCVSHQYPDYFENEGVQYLNLSMRDIIE